MSCRHCRERLSAFLDHELPPDELAEIGNHLECCSGCNLEYRALAETKRALASLGARVSREEVERLLQTDVGDAVRRYANMPVSPRTITAAILSVIGLCVATARITSRETRRPLPEGAYLVSQPGTDGRMHYSLLEVRNVHPMPAETCISLPSNGMLFCAPSPAPRVVTGRAFFFQASFTTH